MKAAVSAVLCLMAMSATVFYFLFFERPFLTYSNVPFPVTQPVIHPGDVVPLEVVRCNASNVTRTYTVSHTLESVPAGRNVVLPASPVTLPPGCTTALSLANELPANVPPGQYRLFGIAEVRGVLMVHYVEWYSKTFTVTPKEHS